MALWLYGFKANELLDHKHPQFDIHLDPKTSWALNNLHVFPLEINRAPYQMLIRVPVIGLKGAKKIVSSRRIAPLQFDDLKKLGIVLKRAQYFITCNTKYYGQVDIDEEKIRRVLTPANHLLEENSPYEQLSLFTSMPPLENKIIFPPNIMASSSRRATSGFLNTTTLLLEDTPTALTGEL